MTGLYLMAAGRIGEFWQNLTSHECIMASTIVQTLVVRRMLPARSRVTAPDAHALVSQWTVTQSRHSSMRLTDGRRLLASRARNRENGDQGHSKGI